MVHYLLQLDNLHCETCEDSIKKILRQEIKDDIDVRTSLASSTVAITSQKEVPLMSIESALENAGFLVRLVESGASQYAHSSAGFFAKLGLRQRHKLNCKKCRDNSAEEKLRRLVIPRKIPKDPSVSTDDVGSAMTVTQDTTSSEYRAIYSIGDMTCAACVNAITTSVKDQLPEVEEFSVDLVNKRGIAVVSDKRLASQISKIIEDTGYTCELVELLPLTSSKSWKVTASIGGMTCSSCIHAITNNVKKLPFVLKIDIDLLNNSGTFVIDDKIHEPELKETIEDSGYDYSLVSIQETKAFSTATKARTVNLQIEGMFCEHCPDDITDILQGYGDSVVINDPISLDHPYIKFTYIPDSPKVTIRAIIKQIEDKSSNFRVQIVKPLTLEERSRMISEAEQLKILRRLLFTVLVAIPTFIIGVVFMGLVPHSNHIGMYLEEPIWVGAVSRSTWALFIMATPVYFFVDDIFHVKSFYELRALWRPGVSWTRRFLKFGSMNLLMSLGTSIAYFASIALLILSARSSPDSGGYTSTYFDSVVFLSMFLLFGRFLDSYSKLKTASAVSLLSNLRPDAVNLVEHYSSQQQQSQVVKISTYMLEISDYIKILPGEACPADSLIVSGSTRFDESALTGESLPVHRAVGDQIFAGTVNNGTDAVIAKVSANAGGSLLDSIVDVVRQSQSHHAPIERIAEVITSIFVPIITALAILTWIIWLSLGFSNSLPKGYLDIEVGGWAIWSLEFSIAVFVVACPCGIGLAAPTALYVGTGLAAKYGILARGGGEAFQDGAQIDVVCFDKTGTLTEGGNIRITDYYKGDYCKGNAKNEELALQLAHDLESASNHPLGRAVADFARENSPSVSSTPSVARISEISGKGLQGTININTADRKSSELNNKRVYIGNELLLEEKGLVLTDHLKGVLDGWKNAGKSIILLGIETDSNLELVCGFAASDTIRQESSLVISKLKDQGIDCWMISGDNRKTAVSIAKQVGIKEDHVISGVLPQEKAEKVKWLQKTGNSSKQGRSSARAIVAMVGDGINDAPALTTADVGIAIGSGSDIALSSAKFILLRSDLRSVLVLINLSKAVLRRIKFNFGWAAVYNLIGVPIAAGIIYPYKNSRLSPVWASLAMALSSVSVVTSSFLLKYHKPPKEYLKNL